jgi:hypothetical protein
MPEEFEKLKRENERNKEKYACLSLCKEKSNISALLGGALLLGAAVGGFMLGIKSPPPGVAPLAAGVLQGAITGGLVWEFGGKRLLLSPKQMKVAKSLAGAVLLAWMPAEMAQNATEARIKMQEIVYNAYIKEYPTKQAEKDFKDNYGQTRKILAFQNPNFKKNTKQITDIIDFDYKNGTWEWTYSNPILFSWLDPNVNIRAYAEYYNDIQFWRKVSLRLPKWCFIWLPYHYKQGKTAMIYSDGEKFINYPRIIWQGKDYFFVWNIKNENKED